jgi:putative flippase GtrA
MSWSATTQLLPRQRKQSPGVDSRELSTFLSVGAAGYVVDVGVFNALLDATGPTMARTLAVTAAMVVTYAGNRYGTWRHLGSGARSREVVLFVVFNLVGFAISLGALFVSHSLLGLTSRFADNVSANVVGVGLGTVFRFVTYRRYVFAPRS